MLVAGTELVEMERKAKFLKTKTICQDGVI